jgi:hypothetical protein
VFRWVAEQPLEPPTQVGSFTDVRLGLGIVAAKEKYGRRGWDRRPEFNIAGGDELEAVGKHNAILVWNYLQEDREHVTYLARALRKFGR